MEIKKAHAVLQNRLDKIRSFFPLDENGEFEPFTFSPMGEPAKLYKGKREASSSKHCYKNAEVLTECVRKGIKKGDKELTEAVKTIVSADLERALPVVSAKRIYELYCMESSIPAIAKFYNVSEEFVEEAIKAYEKETEDE